MKLNQAKPMLLSLCAAAVFALPVAACASSGPPPKDNGLNTIDGKGTQLPGKSGTRPDKWREIPAGASDRTAANPGGPTGSQPRVADPQPEPARQSAERTRQLASEAHVRGEFAKAIALWNELVKLNPKDGEAHYSLARSLARAKDARGAADSARSAWDNGQKDIARYTDEPDFSVIKDDPAWIGLLAELKARAGK